MRRYVDEARIAPNTRREANASDFLRLGFIIVAPRASYEDVKTCGGCKVLIGLAKTLRAIGHQARILPMGASNPSVFHRQCNAMSVAMTGESSVSGSTKLVVVYPESFPFRCTCDSTKYAHVLWMLSDARVLCPLRMDRGDARVHSYHSPPREHEQA